MLLRCFDVILAFFGLVLTSPLLLLLFVLGIFDTGSPLFIQERLGRHKKPFLIYKFRTMRIHTVSAPTHLVRGEHASRYGQFLRRSKLDELPQLWNVLLGEMSFVGPRPGLAVQADLTKAREVKGVFNARPGITGLAQVNGVDMSTPEVLADLDYRMLKNMRTRDYFFYIKSTISVRSLRDSLKL